MSATCPCPTQCEACGTACPCHPCGCNDPGLRGMQCHGCKRNRHYCVCLRPAGNDEE